MSSEGALKRLKPTAPSVQPVWTFVVVVVVVVG